MVAISSSTARERRRMRGGLVDGAGWTTVGGIGGRNGRFPRTGSTEGRGVAWRWRCGDGLGGWRSYEKNGGAGRRLKGRLGSPTRGGARETRRRRYAGRPHSCLRPARRRTPPPSPSRICQQFWCVSAWCPSLTYSARGWSALPPRRPAGIPEPRRLTSAPARWTRAGVRDQASSALLVQDDRRSSFSSAGRLWWSKRP